MSPREDLPVSGRLVIAAGEIREEASRSSGPGGQHVNKTSTRVSLRWNVPGSECLTGSQRRRLEEKLASRLSRGGDLVVHCDNTRSRARNRELARERLAEIVAAALARPRPRRPTAPTRASRTRRLEQKTRRGSVKKTRGPVRGEGD